MDTDWDSVGRSDIVVEEDHDEEGNPHVIAVVDVDLLKFGRDDEGELDVSEGEIALDDLRTIVTVRGWIDESNQVEIELLYFGDEDWIDNHADIQREIDGAVEEISEYFQAKIAH